MSPQDSKSPLPRIVLGNITLEEGELNLTVPIVKAGRARCGVFNTTRSNGRAGEKQEDPDSEKGFQRHSGLTSDNGH